MCENKIHRFVIWYDELVSGFAPKHQNYSLIAPSSTNRICSWNILSQIDNRGLSWWCHQNVGIHGISWDLAVYIFDLVDSCNSFFSCFDHINQLWWVTITALLIEKKNVKMYFDKEFVRCVHQFVSPILSTIFSQFELLKKKASFLLAQNIFFSVCHLKKKS